MGLKDLLSEIGQQVDQACISDTCSGDGCRVYLTDVPSDRIIVDIECEFKKREIETKRCDYALFYTDVPRSRLVVALIELKSGDFKAPDVRAQLQGAADFVAEVLRKLLEPAAIDITCVPILFHGRGIHKLQLRELERAKVRFFGQIRAIKRGKCGEQNKLASIFEKELDIKL